MANFVYITLDTVAPQNPTITLSNGSKYTTNQLVTVTIGTTDPTTTNYQMKLWGDVDASYDTNIKATENTSSWISYLTSKQIKLSSTVGTKKIYLKIRDNVLNESSQVFDDIILDTAMPLVTTTTPDRTDIGKNPGANIATFSFSVDKVFAEYKVKVVGTQNATHDSGVQIPTTNGSVNVSGNEGNYDTSTSPISVQINGSDLEIASPGHGQKLTKVFVKDLAGNWCV